MSTCSLNEISEESFSMALWVLFCFFIFFRILSAKPMKAVFIACFLNSSISFLSSSTFKNTDTSSVMLQHLWLLTRYDP
ncbi:MAG: hypothetical protein EAX81_08460 [Candidatus Thorarchaeota archaeon]|nr:hypothetical protein [Candidatus Thorarchaeota archaeon]